LYPEGSENLRSMRSSNSGSGAARATKLVRTNVFALLLYSAISVGVFGSDVMWHPARSYVGGGPDPTQMMWFLVWWPYAILHRLNPFLTKVVWAPSGVNLAWMTPIPGPSLLAFPVTYSFGPVVSYNLLALIAPALSAWAAYCLCAHITRRFLPSLAGGYLYGFSSYEAGHVLGGHLGHSLVMLPPLVVLLFLRLVEEDVSHPRFIVYLTGCLLLQFLISTALFATLTVFGLFALFLAWWLGDPALRSRLRRSIPDLAVSYIFAAIAFSAYLYYILAFGMPRNPIWPLNYYSADLAGFIVPNKLCHFNFRLFGLDTHFLFDPWENGAYLGVPLLALCGWYCLENRTAFSGKLLTLSLVGILLAALGPRLHVAGSESVVLPWIVAAQLPLIKHELPGRFMLFAFLIIAIMTATWLSRRTASAPVRVALLFLSVLLLWPSVENSKLALPTFFTMGAYRHLLRRNENVLVVPFGSNEDSMLWQAESLMYFRLAGGYLGKTPTEFNRWPIVRAFYSSILIPDVDNQLRDFLAHYQVEAVLLQEAAMGPWKRVFSKLDPSPLKIGGVTMYRVRTEALRVYRHTDPAQAEGRVSLAGFAEMLTAVSQYLQRGLDPAKLNCARAQQLGLLPDRGESTDAMNHDGWCHLIWLGPLGGGNIGIGLTGYYQGVKPVIARYGPYATKVFYPYPLKIGEKADPDALGVLLMIFDRGRLALASTVASSNEVADRATRGVLGNEARLPLSSYEPTQADRPAAVAQRRSGRQIPAASEMQPGDSTVAASPVIAAVDGVPVTGRARGEARYQSIILPVVRSRWAFWGPWWREAQADNVVVIDGHNFDTKYGVAVDLYCPCPGGERGPFFLEPGYHPFSETRMFLKLPVYGSEAPLAGLGSIVVSNKGRDGCYAAKSNRVPVLIGNPD
jgi:hypothetical protein